MSTLLPPAYSGAFPNRVFGPRRRGGATRRGVRLRPPRRRSAGAEGKRFPQNSAFAANSRSGRQGRLAGLPPGLTVS